MEAGPVSGRRMRGGTLRLIGGDGRQRLGDRCGQVTVLNPKRFDRD